MRWDNSFVYIVVYICFDHAFVRESRDRSVLYVVIAITTNLHHASDTVEPVYKVQATGDIRH